MDSSIGYGLSSAADFLPLLQARWNMASTPTSQLGQAIEQGEFIVTAEITPRLTGSADDVLQQALPLKGKATAVNVTDGAGARVAMSSIAASAILAQNGIEPVMQMTCRDRNRIAIAADLIGAAALGIQNVLVLTGDKPGAGDEPDAKGVFDFTANDIITLARQMTVDGTINSGRELQNPPSFVLGGVDAPFDPPDDWQPEKLAARSALGMQFIQTQFCYDPEVTQRYVDRLGEHGLLDDVALILGIGPIASLRSAKWMDENLFGVSIPEQ